MSPVVGIGRTQCTPCPNPSLQGMHAFGSIVVYTFDYSLSENKVVQPVLINKLRKSSVIFYLQLQKRADVFHI